MEIVLIAFFLGIKHSFDVDHILAVSNFLSKPKSIRKTIELAANWSIGHVLGAIVVTILLFIFKDSILSVILDKMELVVGLMLIGFGLFGLFQSRFLHAHKHVHNGTTHKHMHIHIKTKEEDHSHKHILGIGMIQGLASNDELLLLLTVFLGLASLGEMIVGVIIFSLGVAAGMILFSILLSLKKNSENISRIINGGVGIFSIIYGVMILFGM